MFLPMGAASLLFGSRLLEFLFQVSHIKDRLTSFDSKRSVAPSVSDETIRPRTGCSLVAMLGHARSGSR